MTRKVLLIPKGFLGDIILTSPALAALKRSPGSVEVSVLCSPATAEILRRDRHVDSVLVYDRKGEHRGWRGLKAFADLLRAERFDVACSFQMSPRTAMLLWLARIPKRIGFAGSIGRYLYTSVVPRDGRGHDVLRNLALVESELDQGVKEDINRLRSGDDVDLSWARLRAPEVDDEALSSDVRAIVESKQTLVALCPGSAWETKRWSVEGFRDVAESLIAQGVRVVLLGAKSDEWVCSEVAKGLSLINLCGKTSLNEMVALIDRAQCVVCNDSLALHIGSATQTPTVAVFCATSPRFGFGPWMNDAVVLEKDDLFCKPCRRHGSRECPTGTRACMTGVSSREVVCAVERFLGEQERGSGAGLLRVIKR